jgi:hypothetical protein
MRPCMRVLSVVSMVVVPADVGYVLGAVYGIFHLVVVEGGLAAGGHVINSTSNGSIMLLICSLASRRRGGGSSCAHDVVIHFEAVTGVAWIRQALQQSCGSCRQTLRSFAAPLSMGTRFIPGLAALKRSVEGRLMARAKGWLLPVRDIGW